MASEQAIYDELVRLNKTMTKIGKFIDVSDSNKVGDVIYDDFEKIKERLQNHQNKFVRDYSRNIKSLNDLRKLEEKNIDDLVDGFAKNKNKFDRFGKHVIDPISVDMKKLGLTSVSLNKSETELRNDLIQFRNVVKDSSGALQDKNDQEINGSKKRGSFLLKYAKGFGTLLATSAAIIAKQGIEAAKVSLKTGTTLTASQIYNSRLMGMSHAELIETHGKYKQTINSANMTTDQFDRKMRESSHSLLKFTGDLKIGAQIFAESAKLYQRFASDQSGSRIDSFNESLAKAQNNFRKITGQSADEFIRLNEELANSSEVQRQLTRMDKTQRSTYFSELAHRRNNLTAMGLFTAQAQETIKIMEGLTGGKGKDRLEKAAKIEQIMGALGLGADGQRAGELVRKGTLTDDETNELDNYMRQAAELSNRLGQGGLHSEMFRDALLAMGGVEELLGPNSNFAKADIQAGRRVDPDADLPANVTTEGADGWVNKIIVAITGISQTLDSFFGTGWIGKLASAIGGIILGKEVIKKAGAVAGSALTSSKNTKDVLSSVATKSKAAGTSIGDLGKKTRSVVGLLGGMKKPMTLFAGGLSTLSLGMAAFSAGWYVGGKINDYINKRSLENYHKNKKPEIVYLDNIKSNSDNNAPLKDTLLGNPNDTQFELGISSEEKLRDAEAKKKQEEMVERQLETAERQAKIAEMSLNQNKEMTESIKEMNANIKEGKSGGFSWSQPDTPIY